MDENTAKARKVLVAHIADESKSAMSCVSAALTFMRLFGRDDEKKIAIKTDEFIRSTVLRL